MAISLFPNVQGTTTVQELAEYSREHVKYGDYDSILSASDLLSAVANDRSLLVNAINSSLLRRMDDAGDTIGLSSQSLVLYADEKIKIRANIWKKPVERAGSTEYDSKLFSYTYAHNHNFELLTVGYLGSGYWTEIYECTPSRIIGQVGEEVELKFLEKTTLPRGKIMLFRASTDVHTQLPPDELSLSLNLMVNNTEAELADQYNFDMHSKKIANLISVPLNAQLSLLTFTALLGAKETFDAVEQLALSDVHWRARKAALECATILVPDEAHRLWQTAADDSNKVIRQAARAKLNWL